ncbi:RecX family transcriptional regulator [Aurantimonas sp. Leaf443]|nr:RecX family transcriptional regulator [Aurantimonas sp. Leaf443]KQT86370.1 RecX family transcriptional regulator [Aurantimonas sp. Leaf443]
MSAEWLSRAAAYYLERYSSSAETLRRVLWRKVQRRAAARGEDAEGFRHLVEATVARFVELQLVDDRRFAEGWLAGQSRRGTSRRMASLRLSQKGVDRDLVEDLMPAGEAADEAERASAHAYARRRRLGPHRLREREERRDRDIAAMMRAGFSFQDSRAAIDGDGGPGSLPG